MGAAVSQDNHAPPAPPNGPRMRVPPLGSRPTHSANPVPFNYPPAPSSTFRPVPTPQPINDRPPVQHSGVVPNVLNLHKSSLTLQPSPQNPNIHLLSFTFDAQVDGAITVYYCARQVVTRERDLPSPDIPIKKLSYVAKGDRVSGKTSFVAGPHQRYNQNPDKGLDITHYTPAELQRVNLDHYPLVIRLEAHYPVDAPVPAEEQVVCQTTFATLVKNNDTYSIQVIAQQVLVNGTVYKILQLYGIGGKSVTATRTQDDSYDIQTTDECVVCLTESCNTACEPCNHLCLCEDCARTLWTETDPSRRKCPVCRAPIVKLLRIIPARASTSPTSSSRDSADNTQSQSQPRSASPHQSHPHAQSADSNPLMPT